MAVDSSHRGSSTDPVRIIILDAADGDSCMDTTNNALRVNLVAGGAGDGAIQDGVTSTIEATVLDYTNSNPLAVRLSDTNGDYVAAGAGTQYTEDDAAPANPVGSALSLVRDDALSGQVTTDGDIVAARGTNQGELYVKHVDSIPVTDNGGNLSVDWGGTVPPIGAGVEATALRVTLATDSTGLVSVDDNAGSLTIDNAALSVTGGGVEATALRVTLASDSTGLVSVDDNSGSLTVDNAALSVTGGGLEATALRVTIASDSTGVLSIDDNAGSLTVDGTVTANLAAGSNNIGDVDVLSIAAGDNNIGNVDIVTMPNVTLAAGTNTNEVVGDVAHDAGVAGNPVLVCGSAQTTDDTAPPNRVSAESDATRLATTLDGAIFAYPHGPQIWSYHENSSNALTDASVHAAPGAGLSLYVTDIVISTGAATALNVFFEESTTTVLGPYYLEAVAGRGLAIQFKTPKKITANTALTVTTSAAIAHGIDVMGFTAPA